MNFHSIQEIKSVMGDSLFSSFKRYIEREFNTDFQDISIDLLSIEANHFLWIVLDVFLFTSLGVKFEEIFNSGG